MTVIFCRPGYIHVSSAPGRGISVLPRRAALQQEQEQNQKVHLHEPLARSSASPRSSERPLSRNLTWQAGLVYDYSPNWACFLSCLLLLALIFPDTHARTARVSLLTLARAIVGYLSDSVQLERARGTGRS
jgi:hypothetical protein